MFSPLPKGSDLSPAKQSKGTERRAEMSSTVTIPYFYNLRSQVGVSTF